MNRRNFLKSLACALPLPYFVPAGSQWLPKERPQIAIPQPEFELYAGNLSKIQFTSPLTGKITRFFVDGGELPLPRPIEVVAGRHYHIETEVKLPPETGYVLRQAQFELEESPLDWAWQCSE